MELKELSKRANGIKKRYAELEMKELGRKWTNAQIMQGFVVDMGTLMKLVMAKEGLKDVESVDEKLAHELSDCLYSVFVLAEKYGVDIEKSFLKTMDEIEEGLNNKK